MEKELVMTAESMQEKVKECANMLLAGKSTDKVLAKLNYLSSIPLAENTETKYIGNAERKCEKCKQCYLSPSELKMKCSLGKPMGQVCEDFESRYIQFPLEVEGIDVERRCPSNSLKKAQLVSVRLADENETHLGFLLDYFGQLGPEISVSYNKKSKTLRIFNWSTPIIFVPALGRVVYGSESWWSRIQSEEDFKEITDADIQSCWYVKLFNEYVKGDEQGGENLQPL